MSEEKIYKLEEKVNHLEFKLDLLFHDSNINRLLYEYDVTKEQYEKIMYLMDKITDKIENNYMNSNEVSNTNYETEIYNITGKRGDYHFAEYIAKAFWEDNRWKEVFPALYGDFPKYKNIINDKDFNKKDNNF